MCFLQPWLKPFLEITINLEQASTNQAHSRNQEETLCFSLVMSTSCQHLLRAHGGWEQSSACQPSLSLGSKLPWRSPAKDTAYWVSILFIHFLQKAPWGGLGISVFQVKCHRAAGCGAGSGLGSTKGALALPAPVPSARAQGGGTGSVMAPATVPCGQGQQKAVLL